MIRTVTKYTIMPLSPSSTLQGGKYTVIKSIAEGGFGRTYLAEQDKLGRKVTIKELSVDDAPEATVPSGSSSSEISIADESKKKKFLKEARLIAGLNHRGVVRIYDVFEENGTAYYAMEYLPGGSLKEKVLREGALSEAEANTIMHKVCDAINYVHARNILHLDIKPSNILFDEDGEPVLIDFGISRHFETGEQTSTSQNGISKGYAPVEQYFEDSHLTEATDIYSLGATLYFLLTGSNPPEALKVKKDGGITLPSGITKATSDAIRKAMSPDSGKRFQKASDFAATLRTDIKAKPAAGLPAKLSSKTVTIISSAVILLAGIAVLAGGLRSSSAGQPQKEPVEKTVQQPQSGKALQQKEQEPARTPAAATSSKSTTSTTASKPSAPSNGSIDLGYATYSGALKNGQPDGNGKLTFKQSHLVDTKDPGKHNAEAGDYVTGQFRNGHIIQGELHAADGTQKAFILIGE